MGNYNGSRGGGGAAARSALISRGGRVPGGVASGGDTPSFSPYDPLPPKPPVTGGPSGISTPVPPALWPNANATGGRTGRPPVTGGPGISTPGTTKPYASTEDPVGINLPVFNAKANTSGISPGGGSGPLGAPGGTAPTTGGISPSVPGAAPTIPGMSVPGGIGTSSPLPLPAMPIYTSSPTGGLIPAGQNPILDEDLLKRMAVSR
jgi:hypothetical protein